MFGLDHLGTRSPYDSVRRCDCSGQVTHIAPPDRQPRSIRPTLTNEFRYWPTAATPRCRHGDNVLRSTPRVATAQHQVSACVQSNFKALFGTRTTFHLRFNCNLTNTSTPTPRRLVEHHPPSKHGQYLTVIHSTHMMYIRADVLRTKYHIY